MVESLESYEGKLTWTVNEKIFIVLSCVYISLN
jgi:hypothetical protein